MSKYFNYNCEGFSIGYNKDINPNKNNFRLHTHEFCELYCFFEGKGQFKVEGNSYPLHSGDILIMRSGEAHYIDIDPAYTYKRLSIHFDTGLFDSLDKSRELLRCFTNRDRGKLNHYTASDFENADYMIFVNNICNISPNQHLNTVANLLPLLNEVAKAFDNKHKESIEDLLIQDIINYLNCNLTEKISLENICEKFYLSKPHLCRIFKQSTGSTVCEYVTAKRLVMARKLLRNGEKPCEIYTECGFGDYSSFYRAFKKRFGSSPNNLNKSQG